jgi:hypothetical protein
MDEQEKIKKILNARILLYFIGFICFFPFTLLYDIFMFLPPDAASEADMKLTAFYTNIYVIIFFTIPFNLGAIYFLWGTILFFKARINMPKYAGISKLHTSFTKHPSFLWMSPYTGVRSYRFFIPFSYKVVSKEGIHGVPSKELYEMIPESEPCHCTAVKFPYFPGICSSVIISVEND